ncbi:MAG: MFS transporter [Oscillochloris sp.]|nr:MFS transporter [Oscillochloris sp.]
MGSVIYIATLAVAAYDVAAEQAGFMLIPLVLASSAGSVLFGRWLNLLGSRLVMLSGFGSLALGAGLLGLTGLGMGLFFLASMLFGLGVGIVVGGTLRTIVLNEVASEQRGVAQGLVNIGIAIGNLLAVAVLGIVADSRPGLDGLGLAYLVAAGLMLVALLLSLGLKPRHQEQVAVAASGA